MPAKKVNPWFAHVKKYAAEHNMNYKDALGKAGATYVKVAPSKGIKKAAKK